MKLVQSIGNMGWERIMPGSGDRGEIVQSCLGLNVKRQCENEVTISNFLNIASQLAGTEMRRCLFSMMEADQDGYSKLEN